MIDPPDDTEAREKAIDGLLVEIGQAWQDMRSMEDIRDIARKIASIADGGPLDPG